MGYTCCFVFLPGPFWHRRSGRSVLDTNLLFAPGVFFEPNSPDREELAGPADADAQGTHQGAGDLALRPLQLGESLTAVGFDL